MGEYDTNADGNINLGDIYATEVYYKLQVACDLDKDTNGDVTACEVFDCILEVENGIRL
jgi:hypothetical protein